MQEALPAEGTRGGSLGHESLRVQSGKRIVFVDVPSFPKQVEGNRWSVPPQLSLAWDPYVVVARVLDPLAHPEPLSEGQTACDITESQAPPVTLSTGGGVRDTTLRHPSHSSTTPEGKTLWRQLCPAPFPTQLCSFLVSRSFLWTLPAIFNPLLCIPLPSIYGNLTMVEEIGIM